MELRTLYRRSGLSILAIVAMMLVGHALVALGYISPAAERQLGGAVVALSALSTFLVVRRTPPAPELDRPKAMVLICMAICIAVGTAIALGM